MALRPRRPPMARLAPASALALTLLSLANATASADAVAGRSISAVEKVIELLEGMAAKAKAMKKAEEVEFAKFEQFCEGSAAAKEKDVAEAEKLLQTLAADSGKLEAGIAAASRKIDELEATVDSSQADLKKAATQHEKDHKSYTDTAEDLSATVYALERAIASLQKQNHDRPQDAAALLQLFGRSGPSSRPLRRLLSGLQTRRGADDFLAKSAPEVAAYEFQSSGLIEMLKKLKLDFTGQRDAAQKETMNAQHAHTMLSQDLTDTIENAKAEIASKTAKVQRKAGELAEKKHRLQAVTADRDVDVAYLTSLKAERSQKGKSFQEKQGLRAEEIQVIEKATQVLRSEDVLGAAQAHLPALLSAARHTSSSSLVQLRGRPTVRRALAAFLGDEGRRLRSRRLASLAETVAATSGDPFAKVKGMISEMIKSLLREENEETEHKGWCDKELGTNAITRTRLQEKVDGLTAQMEADQASMATMAERLAELAKEVEELNAAVAEATKLRQADKEKNAETAADAAAAQQAISSALKVLAEFYKKASGATALLQASQDPKPVQFDRVGNEEVRMGSAEWQSLATADEGKIDRGHKQGMQTFGETYTGLQSEFGGVLAMLEVISGDFASLEADTQAEEAASVAEYEDFMATSKKGVATKTKERDMLTADQTQVDADLSGRKKDLSETQDQALAAERYLEKLRPSCLDHGVTYERRTASREEEMRSLTEALRILKAEG